MTHLTGGRRWTDTQLQALVPTATTWAELASELGYAADSGSAGHTLRAHCSRLALDVCHLDGRLPATPGVTPTGSQPHLASAGALLVAAALALEGRRIAWPLEPSPYDLLADDGAGVLRRIQVKTTTQRRGRTWACHLTRSTYDSSVNGGKRRLAYDPRAIDDLAVVDGRLSVYVIPYRTVAGISVIHLSAYERCVIARFNGGQEEAGQP